MKLTRRAGVAISIAMQDDEYGQRQLERYLEELDDNDLARLADVAKNLSDTAVYCLGRRHS
jgi:hypothetical protein